MRQKQCPLPLRLRLFKAPQRHRNLLLGGWFSATITAPPGPSHPSIHPHPRTSRHARALAFEISHLVAAVQIADRRRSERSGSQLGDGLPTFLWRLCFFNQGNPPTFSLRLYQNYQCTCGDSVVGMEVAKGFWNRTCAPYSLSGFRLRELASPHLVTESSKGAKCVARGAYRRTIVALICSC